ncbi:MAG: hypothetical protein HY332_13115 [Chloroflexi bacterium]|nr:hypothetical protein [Chloroflexota bacterium]
MPSSAAESSLAFRFGLLHRPTSTDLIVRTLVDVVGAVTQARYAASQTSDPTLRRVFEGLAATGGDYERELRKLAAAHLEPHDEHLGLRYSSTGPKIAALTAAVGTAIASIVLAALAYRKDIPRKLRAYLTEAAAMLVKA